MAKSWNLNRRLFLQGTGVALGLPMLEGMSLSAAEEGELPRRFCTVYFPFGASLPNANSDEAMWSWLPHEEGADFKLTKTMESMAPHRDDISFISGLSHPNGRSMGGHDTGDIFLTAASFKGSRYINSISLDQVYAAHVGEQTRFPSLTLSSDGGVGEPTRSTTLSYSRNGRPIPALNSPKQIFARLFGREEGSVERARLENSGSMLDLVLEHSRSVKRQLSKQDQVKFDEYLSSVRSVEQRVDRAQRWLEIPKPQVDEASVATDATVQGPQEFIKAMYDLMYLAFQTDSTRAATYMIGSVSGATTVANAFPACIGLPGNYHGLAHGAGKAGGAEKLGRWDQFLASQMSYFMTRLRETPEGGSNMLDRTVVLYGSSNSRTHSNRNYPLLVGGGRELGFKHGQHVRFSEQTPMSDLLVTILGRLNVPKESFVDSTGDLPVLLS